jgi:hypothetical protein
VIGRRGKGPLPIDLELFHSYWLISGRLRSLFACLDPQAFAFQACDVRLRDGAPGPELWLCDVIRVIEAFDEGTRQELSKDRNRFPALRNARALMFDEATIGIALFSRTPQWPADVFCDQSVKDACKLGQEGATF